MRQPYGKLKHALHTAPQIYSSHYTEAGLGVLEMAPLAAGPGKVYTLTSYTVRLQVDLFGGLLGSARRRLAQPAMIDTMKESLLGLRARVEAML